MRLRARVHTREGAPGNATAGASVMMPARRAACGTYGLRDQGHLCSLDFWPPRSITHAHIHSSGAFGFASTSSSNARKDNGSPTVAGVALHSSPDVFDGASVTRKSHLTVKREGTKRKRREKPENGKRSAMYRWNCPVDTNHSCVMARSPFLICHVWSNSSDGHVAQRMCQKSGSETHQHKKKNPTKKQSWFQLSLCSSPRLPQKQKKRKKTAQNKISLYIYFSGKEGEDSTTPSSFRTTRSHQVALKRSLCGDKSVRTCPSGLALVHRRSLPPPLTCCISIVLLFLNS